MRRLTVALFSMLLVVSTLSVWVLSTSTDTPVQETSVPQVQAVPLPPLSRTPVFGLFGHAVPAGLPTPTQVRTSLAFQETPGSAGASGRPADGLEPPFPLPFDPLVRPGPELFDELVADPGAAALFEQMRACFEGTSDADWYIYVQAECYEEVIGAAARVEHPVVVTSALNALVLDRPDVFQACHNGGHVAGYELTAQFWDPSAPPDLQYEQLAAVFNALNDVCHDGLIHGMYDAVGDARPGRESFEIAARLCMEVSERPTGCAHGMGHATWLATMEFAEALELCETFDDLEFRYRCDDGVVMFVADAWTRVGERWAADPTSRSWEPRRFYKRASTLCVNWPLDRVDDPQPQTGCWIGVVAGLLFRPMAQHVELASRDYWAVRDELTELVRYAERVCAGFGSPGADVCFGEWPPLVHYVATGDRDAIEDLCGVLVERGSECLRSGLRVLEEHVDADSEISRFVSASDAAPPE